MDNELFIHLLQTVEGLAVALTPELVRLLESERFRDQISDSQLVEVIGGKINTVDELLENLRHAGTN